MREIIATIIAAIVATAVISGSVIDTKNKEIAEFKKVNQELRMDLLDLKQLYHISKEARDLFSEMSSEVANELIKCRNGE